jgi:AraC-like DNA-binding protein
MIKRNIEITFLHDDKLFAKKVEKVLTEHLTQPTFNSTRFSELLGISRAQLHRKLKAYTGLSTSNYINFQRIRISQELLKEYQFNISVVATGVGYKDVSYFNKNFKKIVGCNPSQYAQKERFQLCGTCVL